MRNSDTSQHKDIKAAAREMDRILAIAHKMTVASSEKRQILFQLTKAPIAVLLKLNQNTFGNSESIRGRVALLAESLLTLRNLGDGQIQEDRSDGFGNCPYCMTTILRIQPQSKPKPTDPWLIYCPQCSNIYSKPLEKLSIDGVGFGTETI